MGEHVRSRTNHGTEKIKPPRGKPNSWASSTLLWGGKKNRLKGWEYQGDRGLLQMTKSEQFLKESPKQKEVYALSFRGGGAKSVKSLRL